MPAVRKSSTKGKHIIQPADALRKGQACLTCKTRKIRCDGQKPACFSCLRTAKFEGRDESTIKCTYSVARRKRTPKSTSQQPTQNLVKLVKKMELNDVPHTNRSPETVSVAVELKVEKVEEQLWMPDMMDQLLDCYCFSEASSSTYSGSNISTPSFCSTPHTPQLEYEPSPFIFPQYPDADSPIFFQPVLFPNELLPKASDDFPLLPAPAFDLPTSTIEPGYLLPSPPTEEGPSTNTNDWEIPTEWQALWEFP
ncbi:hypothetical protein T439DRAFT_384715 [Meredithblackwellia eburnea MCA 4105]